MTGPEAEIKETESLSGRRLVEDSEGHPMILFDNRWALQRSRDTAKSLTFHEVQPGRIVRERMEGWSLDTSALQVSQNRSTGEVHVELEAGQPSFHILNDQAYDEIQLPDFPISDSEFSLL